jgi:uncharacterized repeat protein (TIGR01451 family)
MNKLLLFIFVSLLSAEISAQCDFTAMINQQPVSCSNQQLAFMGYAPGSCSVSGSFNYQWTAYVADQTGTLNELTELTVTGSSFSGTTFPLFSIPMFGYVYAQVCFSVNYVDVDGIVQAETSYCLSDITLSQPMAVTASVGNNSCGQPSCLAQFMAIGGTPPYAYLLSNGQVISPSTWNCFDVPGTYVLTAVDAMGCQASTSFTITGGMTENASCETAQTLLNGIVLNDTLCSINQEQPACSNGMSYYQYGWYSFNSENYTHANIAFHSGYNTSPAGTNGGYSFPSAIEVYQEVGGGGCNGSELVYCHNFAGSSSATGGTGVPPCFDLADSVAIQPNTIYYIKYMTQWTSWVPLQGLVLLNNEPVAPLCGCTDNTSCNYDPDALISDGSCGWSGCMDVGACNYQQWVTCDNGSCVYGSDINGLIFHDVNGDGIRQTWAPAEPVLSNIGVITIEELGVLIYPDANGQFVLPDIPQASYTVSFEDPNGYWLLNVDSVLHVTLPTCNGLNLPLIPASQVTAQISGLSIWSNSTIHCSAGFNPGFYIYNNGNMPLSGTFTMTYDPSLNYGPSNWAGTGVTVVPPTEASAGTLTWTISNQPAGSLFYYQVHILGPGAATTGQSFPFAFSLTLEDASGGVFYTNEWNYNPTVTCSYDPNDKQAEPAGWTEQHFITAGQEIEYRIRFQNTGNAPAFNVRIEDQIDVAHLDLSSLMPIAASHSYSTVVNPDGMVQFVFDNILLPDSVHDEPNSHGWVVYRIRSIDSLQPLDVIQNSASIYFDENDPVITNTYTHTIFDCALIPDPNGVNGTCEGQSVLLNIFPELDYTESYSWFVDGAQVGNEVMYDFPADAAGNYSIVLNRTNPFCNEFDTLNVEVWPMPGNTIAINGVSLEAPAGAFWDWHLNGVSTGINTSTITPMVSGVYSVITTNQFGCAIMSEELNYTVENVSEAAENAFQVFPNPSGNFVNFTIPQSYRGVVIRNMIGQIIHADANAMGVQQLDVSRWTSGVYRIEIQGLNGATLVVK